MTLLIKQFRVWIHSPSARNIRALFLRESMNIPFNDYYSMAKPYVNIVVKSKELEKEKIRLFSHFKESIKEHAEYLYESYKEFKKECKCMCTIIMLCIKILLHHLENSN